MSDFRIATLAANGFQEEECLVPRFALQLLGAQVDIVSRKSGRLRIYSYFRKVGTYDVERAIDEVADDEDDGVLIPGGAKSPLIPSGDERLTKFVQAMAGTEKLVASICRGAVVRNFISSRHPRDIKFLPDAICEYLWGGAKQSPFNDRIAE